MSRWGASMLLLVAGCSFKSAGGVPSDAEGDAYIPDSPVIVDAPPDIAIGAKTKCYGHGLGVSVCLDEPTAPLVLDTDEVINTETSTRCLQADPTTACVLAGSSVTISAKIGATGKRPLVILATATDMLVSGTVDVASHRNNDQQHTGAASDQGACDPGVPPDDTNDHGGGGHGGTFAGPGGNGGNGYGGPGGIAAAAMQVTALRGGCPGAHGAGGGNSGGGGHGGGAVYLYAQASLTIRGVVNASGGSGGGTGSGYDGGGGGGSGGLIALDAATLNIDASANVFANGGGGGAGSGWIFGGNSGGESSSADAAAGGGTTDSSGANGGKGSVNTSGPDSGGSSGSGGGAGGGGAGAVRCFGDARGGAGSVQGHISPPMSCG